MGAGGRSGSAGIGACRSVCHNGMRLSTDGITVKLYTGGGEGIAHSSVAPPHGLLGAVIGCQRVRSRFQKNTSVARPIRKAPIVDARLNHATPSSDE